MNFFQQILHSNGIFAEVTAAVLPSPTDVEALVAFAFCGGFGFGGFFTTAVSGNGGGTKIAFAESFVAVVDAVVSVAAFAAAARVEGCDEGRGKAGTAADAAIAATTGPESDLFPEGIPILAAFFTLGCGCGGC